MYILRNMCYNILNKTNPTIVPYEEFYGSEEE